MTAYEGSAGIAGKHNEAAALVAQMTVQEKAACGSGSSFWQLQPCERLGLPPVMITDGPHGLRKQQTEGDHVGLSASVPATCFPTASALAASWDIELLRQVGVALGEQCVAEKVTVLLGPGMNIKRHPLCGRNFEYFSEDPLLSGEMAAAMVLGVQSQGVGTSLKHFAVNNQECARMYVDAIVDERTLREIYLRGFEIAVKKAQPWTVMCAYNRINGEYCSEHHWLLNQVLRDEWGFQGLVMTDWGAANDRVHGVKSGLDLEMPSSGGVNDARLELALRRGELPEAVLDRAVVRNVSLTLCGAELEERELQLDQEAHHALARRAAAESAVLLKNDGGILPLSTEPELATEPTHSTSPSIAVIGAFAKQPRYQGTGSSQVNPTRLDCAFDAIAQLMGGEERLSYAAGYEPVFSNLDDSLLEEAVRTAGQAEVAIVFAGLPVTYESEGFDRPHMRLPDQHNRLIEAVCEANANTAVVLSNGAPVEMPWVKRPKVILESYLAGQAGGGAVADLLFGKVNPSGKLAESFPLKQSDVPADRWFPGEGRQVQYREGLYVGYRYFDSASVPVLFPFGHGLSYTEFTYANLRVAAEDSGFRISVDVTNVGSLRGSEVVQVYVHDVECNAYRPEHELKGFAKIALEPGETGTVDIHLARDAFALFDPEAQSWVVEGGAFEVRVGASSRDIRLATRVDVASQDRLSERAQAAGPRLVSGALEVSNEAFASLLGRALPPPEALRPLHLNSALLELRGSWLGRRIRAQVVKQFKRNIGGQGTEDSDPTLAKMFEEMANHMPLRSFALFSGGRMSFKSLQILIALLNHRYLEAVRLLCGGEARWQ